MRCFRQGLLQEVNNIPVKRPISRRRDDFVHINYLYKCSYVKNPEFYSGHVRR